MIDEEEKIPFTAHLDELRQRLVKSFIAIIVGFVVCFGFKEKLFAILTAPLVKAMNKGDTLVYTGLPEAFFTYLKVAFLAGLLVSAPVIIYQFWMFIAPGLYKRERRMLLPIVLLSSIFFIGGSLFGYFIVFPFGFKFFLSFANAHIRALPSMKEYLAFAAKMLIAFGLIFELPLVITFLARLGIISSKLLTRNRKYAILIIFIVSAILTPPDVVTQCLMAGPLIVLFEISILGARIFGKPRRKADAAEETTDDDSSEAPADA
jgi:sec-independent protein translocase protein TatC